VDRGNYIAHYKTLYNLSCFFRFVNQRYLLLWNYRKYIRYRENISSNYFIYNGRNLLNENAKKSEPKLSRCSIFRVAFLFCWIVWIFQCIQWRIIYLFTPLIVRHIRCMSVFFLFFPNDGKYSIESWSCLTLVNRWPQPDLICNL